MDKNVATQLTTRLFLEQLDDDFDGLFGNDLVLSEQSALVDVRCSAEQRDSDNDD